jgi:hypothetical protein
MLTENYTASAAQTVFTFTFDVISTSYISVLIDDVSEADWTRTGEGEITFGGTVTLAGGETVSIVRTTPIAEALVNFASPSSVRSREINLAVEQLLHKLQETDAVQQTVMVQDSGGTYWVGEGLRLNDLAEPTALTDATTKQYVDNLLVASGALPVVDASDEGFILTVDSGGNWVVDNFIPVPDVGTDVAKMLVVDGTGAYVLQAQPADELPVVTAPDVGKLLTVDGAGDWVASLPGGDYLPVVDITDNGKHLVVNASGVWVETTVGGSLPTVTGADSGKHLVVDVGGSWVATLDPDELPAVTVSDDGKFLKVDAAGDWVAEADGTQEESLLVNVAEGLTVAWSFNSAGTLYGSWNTADDGNGATLGANDIWTVTAEATDSKAHVRLNIPVYHSGTAGNKFVNYRIYKNGVEISQHRFHDYIESMDTGTAAKRTRVIEYEDPADAVAGDTWQIRAFSTTLKVDTDATYSLSFKKRARVLVNEARQSNGPLFNAAGTVYSTFSQTTDDFGASLGSGDHTWTIDAGGAGKHAKVDFDIDGYGNGTGDLGGYVAFYKNGVEQTDYRQYYFFESVTAGSTYRRMFRFSYLDPVVAADTDTYQVRVFTTTTSTTRCGIYTRIGLVLL